MCLIFKVCQGYIAVLSRVDVFTLLPVILVLSLQRHSVRRLHMRSLGFGSSIFDGRLGWAIPRRLGS